MTTKVYMKPADGSPIIEATLEYGEWKVMYRTAEWKGKPLLWIQAENSRGERGERIYLVVQRKATG